MKILKVIVMGLVERLYLNCLISWEIITSLQTALTVPLYSVPGTAFLWHGAIIPLRISI